MKKYKLSQQADDDLLQILIDGMDQWGVKQTEKYASELEECFNMLAEFPNIGTIREDLNGKPQSFIKGSHIIIYRIVETNLIEIATILPQRMRIKKI